MRNQGVARLPLIGMKEQGESKQKEKKKPGPENKPFAMSHGQPQEKICASEESCAARL